MKTTYPLSEINQAESKVFGGKAAALWRLHEAGFRIPETVCISTGAYRRFMNESGLQERIQMELHRKKFSDMRWEEIWDAALRIRNMFLRSRMEQKLSREINETVAEYFADTPVVVRSSAPEEDAAATSFAGLHESFVNIRGAGQILEHVKLVWASLWSDRALLYRQELGLDIAKSAMAVVVQELVSGDVSGVAFSVNPTDATQGVVEAVYGLNQGLVDGAVEPDRWLFYRKDHTIKEHIGPTREKVMIPDGDGVLLRDLPADKKNKAPLGPEEVAAIYVKALSLEEIFGKPQDVEWTKIGSDIFILQSRPVTARQDGDADDKRGWYLSLHRSQENLKKLRAKIEKVHFPAMIREAAELADTDLQPLTDQELAEEIARRGAIKKKWTGIYWQDFIPFAHGMRLFGQLYNDAVSPEDPFEFVELLSSAPLMSLNRNAALHKIAVYVQQQPALQQSFTAEAINGTTDPELIRLTDEFIAQYGDPFCTLYGDKACAEDRKGLVNVIMQMAGTSPAGEKRQKREGTHKENLVQLFLEKFRAGKNRAEAEDMLDLARASYRLRDDDNIMLGKIEEQFVLALQEGRSRLRRRHIKDADLLGDDELIHCLVDTGYSPSFRKIKEQFQEQGRRQIKARQLLGQPAGPGIGRGRARVIHNPGDLALFKKGEILVCDAVDPNMTFVVPLAAGVVERRGGMLIHGAIIAREYGIACVTGVPDAVTLIHNGDEVTVDGYLGIVTVGQSGSTNTLPRQQGGK
jgi:pyruvate,water dikinase